MDFKFTPEQEALKEEFEEFFEEEAKRAPDGFPGDVLSVFESDENWAYHCSAAKRLGEKGWLSLHWPKEHGGKAYGPIEHFIFHEVRTYYRVPGVDINGPTNVAASIMDHGSEEVRKRWLPGIASGEINWCQGWSEPNSGSDLASLATRAVEDGDDYVINGQKTWTTGAHRADNMFLLARTDPEVPKHKGLTYFLTPMDRPGITVKPLLFMHGKHEYNETFFDNLRIPKKNIVGKVNNGWYVAMSGMKYERSGVASFFSLKRDLEDLIEFCRQATRNGKILGKYPIVRQRLAELAVEIEAWRQWAYYVASLQSKDKLAFAEGSVSKYFGTELAVRFANVAVEIMGLYGTLKKGSKWAVLQGRFEDKCQSNLGMTIAGGTNEIQKNIIAWMGLNLPRS